LGRGIAIFTTVSEARRQVAALVKCALASRMTPSFIVHHRRTGVAALNVVTAALDSDARTADTDVVFARNTDEMVAALRAACERDGRAVAGWSFYSTDFAAAARELALVRDATPGLSVLHVAGGAHATAEPAQTAAAGFDLVAVGEGETTIVELFAALREGRDPRDLQGLAHLDGKKLVSRGPGARRPLDAFPAFNARYRKWNPIEITRGCIYACSFCQTPFMFKARFRHRSVENIREHLVQMRRSDSRFVRFVTPTCLSYGSDDESVNLEAIEQLLATAREVLGADGRIYFGTFPSEVRPEHITEDALRLLSRYVDNKSLIIGGQSGSDRVLAATHRGHDVAAVERAVRLSVQHGFRPDVDFLFGTPGETEEDRVQSLLLAQRLVALGARIHNHSFLPLPGTPLKDGLPARLEGAIERGLGQLEATGQLHGTWRAQLVQASELVKQREDARSRRR
jgi:B12-binding domain/radical SAM domain protein